MEIIHDPIYGDIVMSELAIKIIDHPHFNRTQHIYQTGNAYKVFPSATHTRKAHMIGTYALTNKLLTHLQDSFDICDKKKELISIGALCHDIGHGPGSHGFDKHVIRKLIANKIIDKNNSMISHEERSCALFAEIARNIFVEQLSDDDVDFVMNVIDPPDDLMHQWEYTIVNNRINGMDTDKLDYIVRDNYIFGLKLVIDIDKIIKNSKIIDNKWCFARHIHDELLNVIFNRYRFHRILNQASIVKFDLSFRDIVVNSPKLYKEVCNIFKTENINAFSKLTDDYILQNGDPNLIKKFQDRNNYILVNSGLSSKPNKNDEVVNLSINICKHSNNPMKEMFFYTKKGVLCDINDSPLDAALPQNEKIRYIFRKK
jgi:HD superfamily phosphohydrolase